MGEIKASDIKAMSVAERLDLIERIWDTLNDGPEELPVPAWHTEVLAERLADFERDPEEGSSWDEVRNRLKGGAGA